MRKMNQEQQKFQDGLRELIAFAKENGQSLTKEQIDEFFLKQKLTEEQKALVLEYLEMEQVEASVQQKSTPLPHAKAPLTAEDEQFVKNYMSELKEQEDLTKEQKETFFAAAAEGDAQAKLRLLEYYMAKIPELARQIHDGSLFFGDLVQEGNVSLLTALETIVPDDPEPHLIEEIRRGMQELQEIHHIQKHQDEVVVHKVNRLKEAIEELSDGEELDFSIAELSAYLDMSVEEIEDILRIAGEEQ